MYKGTFIYNFFSGLSSPISPRYYRTINHEFQMILWYSKGTSYTYELVDYEYPYEDYKGKYRTSEGGAWSKNNVEKIINKYGDNAIIKNNKVRGVKYYAKDEVGKRRTKKISSNIDGHNFRSQYPTQKPFRLLERIICLSTK